MKYQADIRCVNGDIVTGIWEDDLDRFLEKVKLAAEDLEAYLGEIDPKYNNGNLYIDVYIEDARDLLAWIEAQTRSQGRENERRM